MSFRIGRQPHTAIGSLAVNAFMAGKLHLYGGFWACSSVVSEQMHGIALALLCWRMLVRDSSRTRTCTLLWGQETLEHGVGH
jgi:hypothetical protein